MNAQRSTIPGLADGRGPREKGNGEKEEVALGVEALELLIRNAYTYRQLGCGLAWLCIRFRFSPESNCTGGFFRKMFFDCIAAETRSFSKRKRASLFPIREGSLFELRNQLLQACFEDCFQPSFALKWGEAAWTLLATHGCNKMADPKATILVGPWTAMEERAVDAIRKSVARRCLMDVESPPGVEEIEKELKSKRVGYAGEEIGTCQTITLEQVLPSLPPGEHGGSIDTLLWVSSQTRDFLLHPEKCLKLPSEIGPLKTPGRLHIKPEDQRPLAQELVNRNICQWIPLDEVVEVHGRPVLNGLFGVEKSTVLPSGRKVLRLIMNLVPSNEILTQLQGTITGLPTITSWQSTVLEGEEELRMFQSDMSSAFYLFRLPEAWRRYLAFNLHAKGCDIGATEQDANRDFVLACSVIPMGWISSVSVMQEVSENLLLTGGLDPAGQIRRTKGLPKFMTEIITQARGEKRVWWHVYLDNFAAAERLIPPQPAEQGQMCRQLAEEVWAKAGVVSSTKKKVSNSSRVEELGAEIQGEGKTVGGSTLRFLGVIRSTLWLVRQKYLVKKWVQIIAGRWVFLMQFRRPTMSLFNEVWTFVSSTKQASPGLVTKGTPRADACCLH